MNVFDIILVVPLLWALYSGFRNGIFVQLGGIAGLVIGIYLAIRLGRPLGNLLGIDPSVAGVAGFIIIMVLVIIGIAVIGRLLRGVFRFAGLGVLDRIGGAALSLVKVTLIVGLLLTGFAHLNRNWEWVDEQKLESSLLYKPLTGSVKLVFPYANLVKEKLLPGGGDATKDGGSAI